MNHDRFEDYRLHWWHWWCWWRIIIVYWILLKSFELVWIGLTMFKTNEFFFVKKDFRDGIYDWEIGWTVSIVNNYFAIDNLYRILDVVEIIWVRLNRFDDVWNEWILFQKGFYKRNTWIRDWMNGVDCE